MKTLTAGLLGGALLALGWTNQGVAQARHNEKATATPIKHVVIIFGENISFDHYFGTYPHALNPPNEPAFHREAGHARPSMG